ncbi:MAG: zinc-ribbon domain-containing protein, partial [Desulfobacterales bacterium]|nr:zinc-ribbon domain-containing protein [Desulfobacterales bacterium]
MIITCNECNTRFNVDEHLLKQTGSKVRCSKCKNVFLAYPSSLSEEPDKASEVTPETEVEAAVSDEETESGKQYKVEEADMEPQEIDLSDIDNSLEIDEDLNAEKEPEESGLELELDLEPEDIEIEANEAVEEKTKESELELELDLDLEPEIGETPLGTEAEARFEIFGKTEIEESKAEEIEKDIIPEEEASKAFNMGTLTDDQEAEKSAETVDVDKIEGGIISQPKVAAKKRISMPVLLLLLAALLISGAYGTYVLLDSVGINIPFVSDLLKPEVQDVGNLKIYTSDINNKFVENLKIGKLLVITGKAKNGYSDARSYISITCKLYIKGKILSKTKTVYCGTVLSELDLINMDLDAINKRLSNRFGDNKSNVKVKEGSIIPFMIV